MNYTHTETSHQKENEYPKLVRDKIPDIIKADRGDEPPIRIMEDVEFRNYLLRKIAEEAEELVEAKTQSNVKEELADIFEIIDSLIELDNIDIQEVKSIQEEKRQKRGGFKNKILLLSN